MNEVPQWTEKEWSTAKAAVEKQQKEAAAAREREPFLTWLKQQPFSHSHNSYGFPYCFTEDQMFECWKTAQTIDKATILTKAMTEIYAGRELRKFVLTCRNQPCECGLDAAISLYDTAVEENK